ncbi:hypothetical protein D3C80_1241400 [compost metagenome]
MSWEAPSNATLLTLMSIVSIDDNSRRVEEFGTPGEVCMLNFTKTSAGFEYARSNERLALLDIIKRIQQ